MRKFIVIFVTAIAALGAVGTAQAQDHARSYDLIMPELGMQGSVWHRMTASAGVTAASEIGMNIGMMASGRITGSGGSMFAGPAVFVDRHITLGWPLLGANAAGNSYEPRMRLMAVFDYDRVTGMAMGDVGTKMNASQPWGMAEAAYRVEEFLGLGAQVQSDTGAGPRIEYFVSRGWSVYSAWTYAWWRNEPYVNMGVRALVH